MKHIFSHMNLMDLVRSWLLTLSVATALFASAWQGKAADDNESVAAVREVRPLPGALDKTPVFNSNSPEVVLGEGILLSTLPSTEGDKAHLDYSFQDEFDLFFHHIADGKKSGHMEELWLGLIVCNTSKKTVQLEVLNGASYLSQPQAPFIPLSTLIDNQDGKIFAGPGDRVTNDLLRDKRPPVEWKNKISIAPGKSRLLNAFPIPVAALTPPLNGRSCLARLKASGPVRLALVARFAVAEAGGNFRRPTADEFLTVLTDGRLVANRDIAPTAPGAPGAIKYGRVSGVQIGSVWNGTITDPGGSFLTLPDPKQAVSFPLSSVRNGSFGSGQIESAPLAVRYPDTAYEAHGNYGVKYKLVFPIKNVSSQERRLKISIECPIKSDEKKQTVQFFNPVKPQVFFRGTVRVSELSHGRPLCRSVHYLHLVGHRGEQMPAILEAKLPPGLERTFQIELLYPPDATPPQLLTISSTLDVECSNSGSAEGQDD